MTPIALSYFILGLSALFWPLTTLLFKRTVLGGQWLMITALLLIGLSIIVYSTFFNHFLSGEYLLMILFMLLSLAVPPMTQMSVTALTRMQGVSRMARLLILPSLTIGLLMAASVIIGGADMYRLWISHTADGYGWHFFEGSWRYNLIVSVHYYLYWAVLVGEVFFVALYTIASIRRFQRQVGEYYSSEGINHRWALAFYVSIAINCIAIILSYIVFPINRPRPLWAVHLFCSVEGIAMFIMGALSYRIKYSAELLYQDINRTSLPVRHDLDALGHQLTQFIEEGAYRNPDISVFSLSNRFRVSQDQVIDALHRIHGLSFSDYIDSLRIEYADGLLSADSPSDSHYLDRIAHQCGYLDADALRHAYLSVMHTPIPDN